MEAAVLEHRRAVAGAGLAVERTGIRFWNVTPERVRIEIEVENRGDTWSVRTPLRVQAAPFGAFLPWTPLAELTVPPIEPRGVAVVRTEARRPSRRAAGGFSGFVPRVSTARGMGDPARDRSPARRGTVDPVTLLAKILTGRRADRRGLPADLYDLLGREHLHWVGNINVLIGSRATERHMARALRVYPGRANLAMFLLGQTANRYVMRVEGDAVAWDHGLFDGHGQSLLRGDGTYVLDPASVRAGAMILFMCCPPRGCDRGSAEVHVRQQRSGREAVVEFSLDANAAGPGCYTA